MSDRVAIIGTGYVGLVTGACLASFGHKVRCHDVSRERIAGLRAGHVPFHEPELDRVVAEAVRAGNLSFTDVIQEAAAPAQIAFLAVGTPSRPDGSADLSAIFAAADACADHLPPASVLVTRSTVPPGTGDELERRLQAKGRADLSVVSAPEFLAEGTAVRDFRTPDRLVFGGEPGATARVAELFRDAAPAAPRIHTDRRTAELAKYAANTFLAARISLVNEFADLSDKLGADGPTLARIVGLDARIGPKFLRAGLGYGGSCFPKDVRAILALAAERGIDMPVARGAEDTNERQWRVGLDAARELVGGSFSQKRVAVWGIAFKPDTDDVRMAPSLRLMQALRAEGAEVVAHDPKARLPPDLRAAGVAEVPDPLRAAEGADLVILATEWAEYRAVDHDKLARVMRAPRILDGRDHLDRDALAKRGFTVRTIGRGVLG